jgi:hypothetical protein
MIARRIPTRRPLAIAAVAKQTSRAAETLSPTQAVATNPTPAQMLEQAVRGQPELLEPRVPLELPEQRALLELLVLVAPVSLVSVAMEEAARDPSTVR